LRKTQYKLKSNLWIYFIQSRRFITTEERILVNEIWDQRSVLSLFDWEAELFEHFLILVNRAEKNLSFYIPIFVFLDNLFNSNSIFAPDILSDKRWVYEDKIKIVVKFLWKVLWSVKIIEAKVWVFLEFSIVLRSYFILI